MSISKAKNCRALLQFAANEPRGAEIFSNDSFMDENKIKDIKIENIWRKNNFYWENLNPDVNILIGVNGSGKTTLFNIIDSLICGDVRRLKHYGVSAEVVLSGGRKISYNNGMSTAQLREEVAGIRYEKVSTFDVPYRDRRKIGREHSQLYQVLNNIVYDIGGPEPSFSDYRLKATNFPEQADLINKRIAGFFAAVDGLFVRSGKVISINPFSNHLVFIDGNEEIPLYKLSSGEKQLLIILLKVFLMENKPYILLMDEPEISLHIEWQAKLFEEILKLNTNCQIITSTHSPSLFGDGWSDKLVFVEDMLKLRESV